MSRTKQGQAEHDREVARIAAKLERQGFDVKVDLPGHPKPSSIGGYIPDVVARKGTERKIVEVETPDSKDSPRDGSQNKAFRAAAERSNNTTFRRVITGLIGDVNHLPRGPEDLTYLNPPRAFQAQAVSRQGRPQAAGCWPVLLLTSVSVR